MTAINYKELKKGGFMKQIQKDHFSMRLKSVGGHLTGQQLQTIQAIAEKYGQGYVHLTSRQGVEIPFIKLEDIDQVKRELADGGVQVGVCGPRVRTITACQGKNICPSGLIDTTVLAKEFDERYGGRELPHKFKFGITGCRNNCLKAEENDLGVKGGEQPSWLESACTFCGLCEAVCPVQAIKVQKTTKKLEFMKAHCIYCGKCVKACPASAWTGKSGFIVSFGGLYGNRIAIGQNFLPIIFSTEVLHQVIEITLEFFAKHAKQGERFASTLDRVGWDLLKKELAVVL
ncbi:MAG: 4Fe-4S binding protein [Pelosinus sp.]|nr:4Fe-4S binding protein [Pelosinus sp.]